jgi:hypothetical protein
MKTLLQHGYQSRQIHNCYHFGLISLNSINKNNKTHIYDIVGEELIFLVIDI